MAHPVQRRVRTLRVRAQARVVQAVIALALIMVAPQLARSQQYKESVLYNFNAVGTGFTPYGGLIRDAADNLYGTTEEGGAFSNACQYSDYNWGCGVVFKLDPSGNETVLYSFSGGADGANPYAGLIMDGQGNLYGTARYGGSLNCQRGCGVVFKLDPSGNETVLYSFSGGADGANPYAGLIMDGQGNLYGTTTSGGTSGEGVAFMLDASGMETVLYSFTGGTDGGSPYGGLIMDGQENLYGTASLGGDLSCEAPSGCGTVFKLSANGNETVLHSFVGTDGDRPYSSLIMDTTGNLYGTTEYGGNASDCGVVFKLSGAGKDTVLRAFAGVKDGCESNADLVLDNAGNLYGTTAAGGGRGCDGGGCGTVFEIDKSGKETVLYRFSRQRDAKHHGTPYAGLLRDPSGNLYGTTANKGNCNGNACGGVFKLTRQQRREHKF